QNGVTFAAGKVGQAFSFDGADDSVSVPASSSLDVGLATGMTLDAWINPSDVSQWRPMIEWYNGTHLWLAGNSPGPGALWINITDTNGVQHYFGSPAGTVVTGQFQHVAMTYDKTTGITTLYRNGVVVAQQNLGIFTPKTDTELTLGRRPGNSFGG